MTILEQAQRARAAAVLLAGLSSRQKDAALHAMAEALVTHRDEILRANGEDVAASRAAGRPEAMIDRLSLNPDRIKGMANGLLKLAALPDPVGGEDYAVRRPNGLKIACRRVPLGVVGMIYEARPNVTADAAGLCVKSGNACILRGGREALASNTAIAHILSDAATASGLPEGAIQLVEDPGRESANDMMRLNGYIDVLIPRGGAALIQNVVQNATVPVIETGVGNCHAYVDAGADIAMAADIVFNAKCSRPSVCNALETLLVHEAIADLALPAIAVRLAEKNVELRGCERTRAILPEAVPATREDYETEFSDYILAVRVVESLEQALEHIETYGSKHSECIITQDYAHAEAFLDRVDAAAVYVNASTRFSDGEEFGLGAEIGISTQKLHARGPMGLRALTTIKYVVRGDGQIR